jgi:hypothetical protein
MNFPHLNALPVSVRQATWTVLALLLAAGARAETKSSAPTVPFLRSCAGELSHSSSSILEDDDRKRWTIRLKGTRCAVDFRMEGTVKFNDDFTDLVSLSKDGSFRLDVTDDGERRQLDILPGRDGLERTWKVNGREQPYDAAARAWLGSFLIELDRRTAVAVEQRLPILLKKGGVSGVLAETGQMSSDYARSVYYAKLASATKLTNADIVKVFDQAASLGTSDHYSSELLKDLGVRTGDDANVRAAMFRMIQKMKSDHYRSESVRQAIGSGKLGARETDFLIDVIQTMESDYYKAEVLKQAVAKGSFEPAQRKRLAALARDIDSDHYAYEFVKALAASEGSAPGEARALIDAAATIDSDHYLSESIAAILAESTLTEADLLAIVKISAHSSSDHYRSEMLRAVLAHRAVTDAVRQAALSATSGMSSHYREEIERVAARR